MKTSYLVEFLFALIVLVFAMGVAFALGVFTAHGATTTTPERVQLATANTPLVACTPAGETIISPVLTHRILTDSKNGEHALAQIVQACGDVIFPAPNLENQKPSTPNR